MSISRSPLDRGTTRARIREGQITSGCFAGMASPMAIEVMAAAGVDWVVLDLEHGGGGEEQVGPAVTAAGGYGASVMVRVETPDRLRIGRVLDAGAAGVMLPRIHSAQQVREALAHLRYPPEGDRGVATYNRSVRWGLDREALESANREITTIVQIETQDALAEVDEIAAVQGVDVLFVGPLDLSYAVGHPLDFSAEEFISALETVRAAARRHSVAAGILSPTPEAAAQRREEGFSFLAVGSDSTLLAGAAAAAMQTVRAD